MQAFLGQAFWGIHQTGLRLCPPVRRQSGAIRVAAVAVNCFPRLEWSNLPGRKTILRNRYESSSSEETTNTRIARDIEVESGGVQRQCSDIHYLGAPMSEVISAADANRQFSRILRAVEAGARFTITSHGRPVAQIGPVGETEADIQARRSAALTRLLDRLEQRPALNAGKWTRDELYER